MDTIVDLLLNWGFQNPGGFHSPGFPGLVYVDAAQWRALSLGCMALTLLIVAAGVAACYLPTRRVGQAFVMRWWLFAIAVALCSGVSVYLYLANAALDYGGSTIHLLLLTAFLRALLASLQGALLFYLLSGLGCLVFGRYLAVRPFVDNRRIPIPHVL